MNAYLAAPVQNMPSVGLVKVEAGEAEGAEVAASLAHTGVGLGCSGRAADRAIR